MLFYERKKEATGDDGFLKRLWILTENHIRNSL